MEYKTFALITAAGMSRRMGGAKKEFIVLKNQPLLYHTVKPFAKLEYINRIYITYSQKDKDSFYKIISNSGFLSPVEFVEGGETRQQSVFNGLKAMEKENPDIVLIHDGCRPLISKDLIKSVYNSILIHGAAAPVIPITDSIKKTDKEGFICAHPDRGEFKAIQTPQGFVYSKILRAHKEASKDNKEYHDDTEIYSRYIGRVATVSGCKKNLKVTYKEDLESF